MSPPDRQRPRRDAAGRTEGSGGTRKRQPRGDAARKAGSGGRGKRQPRGDIGGTVGSGGGTGGKGRRPAGRDASKTPAGGGGQPRGDTNGTLADDGGDERRVRLNKVLSTAGLGSRRAVEDLVRAGRVSVGGRVVTDLGQRVDPERDQVAVDGSRVVVDQRRRYWLLNKPAGVVTTADDPQGRPTVVQMVPAQPRVFPVGRLDLDTEGLLILTNDGDLAHRLTHARFGVEKRYLAEVEQLPPDALARLRRGVELDDGPARAQRARIVGSSGRRRMVEVIMLEGRNREVRRLLDAVGAPVRRLVRTAVGPLRLTGLAPGEYRPLRQEEVRRLYRAVGL
jgi:23S rRNA pseudouridine2605 synthase